MRRWFARFGIGVAVVAFAGFFYVWVFGSVLVRDETGAAGSAVITDDHKEQALIALPGGYFFAVPGVEGIVEVRCRDGTRGRAGYVSAYTHTWVEVIGDAPCRRVVEWR